MGKGGKKDKEIRKTFGENPFFILTSVKLKIRVCRFLKWVKESSMSINKALDKQYRYISISDKHHSIQKKSIMNHGASKKRHDLSYTS